LSRGLFAAGCSSGLAARGPARESFSGVPSDFETYRKFLFKLPEKTIELEGFFLYY